MAAAGGGASGQSEACLANRQSFYGPPRSSKVLCPRVPHRDKCVDFPLVSLPVGLGCSWITGRCDDSFTGGRSVRKSLGTRTQEWKVCTIRDQAVEHVATCEMLDGMSLTRARRGSRRKFPFIFSLH